MLRMTELCVNIDHVATVRQARRTWEPDPVLAAAAVEQAGAHGITVHLREDRRHIQDVDVVRLRAAVTTKLNFEMAATEEMITFACAIQPEMAMLVPEGRLEVTTEGGLDIVANRDLVSRTVDTLKGAGIVVSAFIDPDPAQVEAAAGCGLDVCEVHTGPYAHAFHACDGDETNELLAAAFMDVLQAGERIRSLGMQFNAGHALHYDNVDRIAALKGISELHIGHSIVSRAVFVGLADAVGEMLGCMDTRH